MKLGMVIYTCKVEGTETQRTVPKVRDTWRNEKCHTSDIPQF